MLTLFHADFIRHRMQFIINIVDTPGQTADRNDSDGILSRLPIRAEELKKASVRLKQERPLGKRYLIAPGGRIMTEPERISPKEVYEKLKAGTTILVCAYEDDKKFKTFHLDGAISFDELRSKLPSLSKDQEIVFYCA